MSNNWNGGYMTDMEYIDGYVMEMSPLMLSFALTLSGVQIGAVDRITPPPKDFSYLELGFGRGSSLNVHAVTSEGTFVGTDFNPTHALMASYRSKMAKANLKIYEYSFEELYEKLQDEKASFDCIVLHGIFSWVSPENQGIILKIIRSHLKMGGVVYNGYNVFPGWAPKAPSRELLYLYSQYASGTTQDKIQGGVKFFEEFLKSKPVYLSGTPYHEQLLESLKKFLVNRPAYIAHEYMNDNWQCCYFHEMVQKMQQAKCDFSGPAKVLHHFDDLHLAPEHVKFLNTVKNPVFKEQLKDYYFNAQFRTDLFTKGSIPLSKYEAVQKFLNTEYVLMRSVHDFTFELPTVRGVAHLDKDLYTQMFECLTSKSYHPKSGREIMEACKVSFERFLNASCILIHLGILLPTQTITTKIKKQSEQFNQASFERQLRSPGAGYLASPLTATGVITNETEQLIVKAYLENRKNVSDIVEYIFAIFQAQNRRCLKDGKALITDDENKEELAKQAQKFIDQKLSIFKVLGIC